MTALLYLIAFEFYLFSIYLVSWYYLTGWWNKPTILGGVIQAAFLISSVAVYLVNRSFSLAISKQTNRIRRIAKVSLIGYTSLILILGLLFRAHPIISQFFDHLAEILFIGLVLTQVSFGNSIIKHPIVLSVWRKAVPILERYGIFLIFFFLAGIKIWFLSEKIHNFVVLDDTYIYWQMAKHLLAGDFSIAEFNHYPPLYPIALIPALWFNPHQVYFNTTILNSIYSSTIVFPLYLLARQFLAKRTSLLFTFTSAFYVYHLIYPGLIMSENISLPLFLWAVYFCFVKPPSPTKSMVWDILLGISIGLFWLSRYLALPLVPVFLVIRYLRDQEGFSMRGLLPDLKRIKELLVVFGIVIFFEALWIVPGLLEGVPLMNLSGFQIASTPREQQLGLDSTLFWTGITSAYFFLMFIPTLPGIIHHLLTLRKSIKQISLWQITIILFALMLFITVTRHAIRADYNYPEPIKYVGRYVLYLTPLLWLSAFINLPLPSKNKKSLWLSLVLSLAGFGAAYYNLFHPGSFILEDLHPFLSTDMIIPWILNGLFIFQVICFLVVIHLASFHNSKTYALLALFSFLIISNLTGMAPVHQYTQSIQRMGYLLDALIQQITDNPSTATYFHLDNSIKYSVTDDFNNFPKELAVRNLTSSTESIEQIKKDPLMRYNCKTRLLVSNQQQISFAVVDDSIQCNTQTFLKYGRYIVLGDPYLIVQLPD